MTESWARANDPELRKIGHFFIPSENGSTRTGTYAVRSSKPLWAVDACQQIGEAVAGIFAAVGIFVCAVLALVAAAVVGCVSCCYMDSSGPQEVVINAAGPPAVVGEPVAATAR